MNFPDDEQDESGLMKMPARRAKGFSLMLTSLIDMFTIILVFLLKSFSAEGEIMTIANDLMLPESTSDKKPTVASIIAVNHQYILLDGQPIVETSSVMSLPPEAKIEVLSQALANRKIMSEGLGEVHDEMGFSGKINIQADKEIPYLIIKKIMMTCGQYGYNDIMLAVVELE